MATPRQIRRRGRFALVIAVLVGALAMTGIALGYVSTDQPDYIPGSVVTIQGNNLNGAGYVPGNTVNVAATADNGLWADTCTATVAGDGSWSCQVTLSSDPAVAVGSYSYTATSTAADGSTISENGTFTDAPNPNYQDTLTSPTGANHVRVQYSDLLTVSGSTTCNGSLCPTGTVTVPVELQLQNGVNGSPFQTWVTVKSATLSLTYTNGVAQTWSFTWQAGKYSGGQVPPGIYDLRVRIEPSGSTPVDTIPGGDLGEHALTIDPENTRTVYTGPASGDTNTSVSVSATVADEDTSLFANDSVFAGTVTWNLMDGATQLATISDSSLSWNTGTNKWDASASLDLTGVAKGNYTIDTVFTPSSSSPATSTYYNGSSDSDPFEVTAPITYTIDGFYQPIDNWDGTIVNGAKAGSTIPIKFNVLLDGVIQSDTSLVKTLVQTTPCTAGTDTDMLASTDLTSGNTSLRFDPTAQQMIYNWKTPKTTGCYMVTLTLTSGASLQAKFQLK